jgi:hypothetical protein
LITKGIIHEPFRRHAITEARWVPALFGDTLMPQWITIKVIVWVMMSVSTPAEPVPKVLVTVKTEEQCYTFAPGWVEKQPFTCEAATQDFLVPVADPIAI